MSKTIERRESIIHLVKDNGKVDVEELVTKFNTSAVTIRGDLNILHSKGLLVRTRGGAIASTFLTKELSVNEKHTKNLGLKQKIGQFAASLINDGESVILDSGTTTEEIAKNMHSKLNLNVMTNGLNIADVLSHSESCNVMMTGGTLRRKSQSFYGGQSDKYLKQLRFDKLFLGVDGFELNSGITTHFEAEAILNRAMCDVSAETIVVTDSSKFGQHGFHIIRGFADFDRLITDDGIPESYVDMLEKNGVIVNIV